MTVRPLILAAALALTGCRTSMPFARIPSAYKAQGAAAVRHVESVTGYRLKSPIRAYVAAPERVDWSASLGRRVGVARMPNSNTMACGWGNGSRLTVIHDGAGNVPDEVWQHEIAHPVSIQNGLGDGHHPAFKGKIWGW